MRLILSRMLNEFGLDLIESNLFITMIQYVITPNLQNYTFAIGCFYAASA